MNRRTKIILAAAAAGIAVATGAGGIAVAASGDDDTPLTGDTYDKAVAAALAETRGGTVTETEVGDDGAAYDVEITLADGKQVEVSLDANFAVIRTEADDDSSGESDDPGDK